MFKIYSAKYEPDARNEKYDVHVNLNLTMVLILAQMPKKFNTFCLFNISKSNSAGAILKKFHSTCYRDFFKYYLRKFDST